MTWAQLLRFGLGRFTTEEQIDYTIKAVTDTVFKIKGRALWEMYKEGIDLNTIEWGTTQTIKADRFTKLIRPENLKPVSTYQLY